MHRVDINEGALGPARTRANIKALITAIEEGFDDTEIAGCCQFVVQSDGSESRFHIRAKDGQLSAAADTARDADAVVTLPAEAIEHILSRRETLDFRDPWLTQRVRFEGRWQIANALATALKKTPDIVRDNYEKAARLSASLAPLTAVPRLEAPTATELAETFRRRQPRVILGALENWAVNQWSFDRFASDFGQASLTTSSVEQPTMRVDTFVRSLQAGKAAVPYTGGCPLPSGLQNKLPFPFDEALIQTCSPTLWMGRSADPAQPVTPLHRDAFCVALAQVIGVKRVVMYSPDQQQNLYPVKAHNRNQGSRVEPASPDLQRFPRFKQARKIETLLKPGEILFIPIGWFHCVFATELTMSVSFLLFGSEDLQLKRLFFPNA